jgi:flagellar motor switch/type III secretory pathway protein FliN
MNFHKWSAPAFSLKQRNVSLWNVAMSHAGRAISMRENGPELSFTPLDGVPSTSFVHKLVLDRTIFGYAKVDAFPFQSYCGLALDVADLDSIPRQLAAALNEGMLLTVLSELPDNLSSRLRLGPAIAIDTLQSQPKATALQWFTCTLSGATEEPIDFTFAAAPDAICAELARNALPSRKVHPGLGDAVAAGVQRLIGAAKLSAPELYGLAPGDCILFTETGSASLTTVLVNDRVFFFTAEGAEWTCVRTLAADKLVGCSTTDELATENCLLTMPFASSDTPVGELGPVALQITVSFCLGSTTLPLSELESWQIGAMVTLPEEISADGTQVTVSANGLAIAQGDLVRIDDRLAVRLNRVLLCAPPQKG